MADPRCIMHINKTLVYCFCIAAKPVLSGDRELIITEKPGEERRNILLNCSIYAYPTPNIQWNITTPMSGLYVMQNSNGNTDYKLHNNGSIEIYHQFLAKVKHIIASCSATNVHGSGKKIFHLWVHKTFTKGTHIYI